jgi:hypothetical protein
MGCCGSGSGGGASIGTVNTSNSWYRGSSYGVTETYTSKPAQDAAYPGHRFVSRQAETPEGLFKTSSRYGDDGRVCSSESSKSGSFLSGLFNWRGK